LSLNITIHLLPNRYCVEIGKFELEQLKVFAGLNIFFLMLGVQQTVINFGNLEIFIYAKENHKNIKWSFLQIRSCIQSAFQD